MSITPLSNWLRTHARRLLLAATALVVILITLPMLAPPAHVAERLTAQELLRTQREGVVALYTTWAATQAVPPHTLVIDYEGPPGSDNLLLQRLGAAEGMPSLTRAPTPTQPVMKLVITSTPDDQATLRATLNLDGASQAPPLEASARRGSWTSLLPPIIAVLIALTLRRLLFALGSAVWLGAALQVHFNPWLATKKTLVDYLWPNLTDTFNLYVIGFTVSLVGMVHIILRMGGMAGLLTRIKGLARSARSTRLTTALMGGALFFDDYANTIVVGSTMRPMSDVHRISREKLAYLVDSTSAPIAGVAIISTWIGYEVGLFEDLNQTLGLGQSGYTIFFEILPLRFYCMFTLGFVLMNAWTGRDFGPMRRAEQRAHETGEVLGANATLLKHTDPEHISPKPDIDHRWFNAVVPIVCVIVLTMFGMIWSGWQNTAKQQIPALLALDASSFGLIGEAFGDLRYTSTWRDAFSGADNAKVLFWSAVLGSLVAGVLAFSQRLLSPKEVIVAWLRAIPAMSMAVAILLLAWSIRAVCDDLNTSVFLVGAVQDVLSLVWLPLITFLLAAAVAFSTGTSWGTMGILLPAIIPLAHGMSQQSEAPEIILMLCFAAVLDGAIFGDHCSPISDTTVMSSLAAECDHVEHVRTQAPYALTTMACAAGFGYVGVALGLPIWAAWTLGFTALFGVLMVAGRISSVPSI